MRGKALGGGDLRFVIFGAENAIKTREYRLSAKLSRGGWIVSRGRVVWRMMALRWMDVTRAPHGIGGPNGRPGTARARRGVRHNVGGRR
jgi:hypothetical protein